MTGSNIDFLPFRYIIDDDDLCRMNYFVRGIKFFG